jgi:hypothetical protein
VTDIVHEEVERIIGEEGENIILRCLPTRLVEMADLIGISAAHRLVGRFGGTRVCFSHRDHANHAVAELIGQQAATKLAQHYGVEEFAVPRGQRLQTFLRNRELIRLRNEGATARSLALQFRLTERQVYQVIATARPFTPETT